MSGAAPARNLVGHALWRITWKRTARSRSVQTFDIYAASEGLAEAYAIRQLRDVPGLTLVDIAPSPLVGQS